MTCERSDERVVLSFDRGTLLLTGPQPRELSALPESSVWKWDARVGAWRCDAIHYAVMRVSLARRFGAGFRDELPAPVRVSWPKKDLPEPRAEQKEALVAWVRAGRRGQIIMPTGTGKTEVAFAAMAETQVATLIVAPVRDLMHQWHRRILKTFGYDADRFTSHLPGPEEFDSALEESFANKFGPARDGWRLIREGDILHERQATFIPDFTFRHDDGTEVFLEIVGFWTPEYLDQKRETLRRFHRHRILLAVPERSLREDATVTDNIIVYKTALKIEPVVAALEAARSHTSR